MISFVLFSACNSNNKQNASTNPEPANPEKETAPVNCYRYAKYMDTIMLKLIHVGESITGTLVYKLSEKDQNRGTIQGAMKGDLLVARYTFSSEGTTSKREVVFKMKDDAFTEGYGDVDVQHDEVRFKDINKLAFNDSMKLEAVPCQ